MTDEEPHGLFRRKVVEAGGFWQIAWLFFTQGFQMASQSLIRMGISQSFDLAPELLHVVTSLIPTSHDICLVRIKTTSMLMVVVRFSILSLRKPALDRSSPQTHSIGDLFGLHPLLTQRHQRYGNVHTARLGALSKGDRKSTRLNSSHPSISYAVFCLKKKKK